MHLSTNMPLLTRRELLAASAAGMLLPSATTATAAEQSDDRKLFRYCLNTSTIRGQNLGIVGEMEIAAKAGYDAVEPWLGTIDKYVKDGGTLRDLAIRIRDLGLTVESAIAFAQWIVDDDAARGKALEQMKRDMDTIAAIGGKRIAAPPAGATNEPMTDLAKIAARYRALLELGEQSGVVPELEVWGFSKTLGRLSEALFVAVETGHPQACILPDVYHLYKGGSGFAGLKLLSGQAVPVIHFNDYPADPPRESIKDEHRIYPGDGVAPLKQILRDLHAAGFRGALSLEVFNRDYWKQDALSVAKTGLEKMRAAVQRGFND
jgi:2-keto-myo-inositol isomerase